MRLVVRSYCSLAGPSRRSQNDGAADLPQRYTRDTPRNTWRTMPTSAHFKMQQTVLPNSTREGKRKWGREKKEERDREERSLFGFRLSPPLPLSTAPSVLLQQCPRTPNEITAAKSRVVRAENVGGRGAPLFRGTTAQDVGMRRTGPPLSAHCCTRVQPASRNLAHPDRTESLV